MNKPGRTRLDSLICRYANISKREVRQLFIRKDIMVDGVDATAMSQVVGPFSHVTLQGESVQSLSARYIMLNKPKGVVSATKDAQHTTVIDLIHIEEKDQLHISGRLDFNTTGLLLLSNDGAWSKRLSDPENNIHKTYRVILENPVTTEYAKVFKEGIYFSYENITTRPALLHVIDDYTVEMTLSEGRYHQVKRMFGHFQNKVLELHRLSVGHLTVDPTLALGESRPLTINELDKIFTGY
jgi:16S rRNA pseudouridine516 synthase